MQQIICCQEGFRDGQNAKEDHARDIGRRPDSDGIGCCICVGFIPDLESPHVYHWPSISSSNFALIASICVVDHWHILRCKCIATGTRVVTISLG